MKYRIHTQDRLDVEVFVREVYLHSAVSHIHDIRDMVFKNLVLAIQHATECKNTVVYWYCNGGRIL